MRIFRNALLGFVAAASACGKPIPEKSVLSDASDDKAYTADKLCEYLAACHAVGDLKFIRDDDSDRLWADIHNTVRTQSALS